MQITFGALMHSRTTFTPKPPLKSSTMKCTLLLVCTIQLSMLKYHLWRTGYIVLYVRDLLINLVILSDTNVWKRDLCQLNLNMELFSVHYIIVDFVAKVE